MSRTRAVLVVSPEGQPYRGVEHAPKCSRGRGDERRPAFAYVDTGCCTECGRQITAARPTS